MSSDFIGLWMNSLFTCQVISLDYEWIHYLHSEQDLVEKQRIHWSNEQDLVKKQRIPWFNEQRLMNCTHIL